MCGVDVVVEYFIYFCVDVIVWDCEVLWVYFGVDCWGVFGQFFGGFMILVYFFMYVFFLQDVFVMGGFSVIG